MKPIFRGCVALLLLVSVMTLCFSTAMAQPLPPGYGRKESKEDVKLPYKVLTSGNQITIRATSDIKTVMAWSTAGSRIVEKTVSAPFYSFRIPTQHKMVFLRIELADGKTYSEKIGIN